MKIEAIYMDMDGVLADFVTASLGAACIPLTHETVTEWNYFHPYMTEVEFWNRIDQCENFWLNLDPYEWAGRLTNFCSNIAPVIYCSSPSLNPDCASAKIQWLRENGLMGWNENNYILTKYKHHLASQTRVLIDDSPKNLLAFKSAGGIAIQFPQPWNTNIQSKLDDPFKHVQDHLMDIIEKDAKPAAVKDSNPKDNVGSRKPGISAVPCKPLYEMGAALTYGGKKYGNHNYRSIGVRASVYYDAAMRHITAWWEGEDIDPIEKGGSGLPHLAHAIAGLMVYRDAELAGMVTDDRPIATGSPYAHLETIAAEICDRYPNPVAPYTQKALPNA